MSDTSLGFPFEYDRVEGIGKLFYPMVRLPVLTINGWIKLKFLVDTGADITTVPEHLLPILGVNKDKLSTSWARGVGGILVKTWETKLRFMFGLEELNVATSVVDTKDRFTPLLLGRKDIFEEKFSLLLDSKHKKTVIYKN